MRRVRLGEGVECFCSAQRRNLPPSHPQASTPQPLTNHNASECASGIPTLFPLRTQNAQNVHKTTQHEHGNATPGSKLWDGSILYSIIPYSIIHNPACRARQNRLRDEDSDSDDAQARLRPLCDLPVYKQYTLRSEGGLDAGFVCLYVRH